MIKNKRNQTIKKKEFFQSKQKCLRTKVSFVYIRLENTRNKDINVIIFFSLKVKF